MVRRTLQRYPALWLTDEASVLEVMDVLTTLVGKNRAKKLLRLQPRMMTCDVAAVQSLVEGLLRALGTEGLLDAARHNPLLLMPGPPRVSPAAPPPPAPCGALSMDDE